MAHLVRRRPALYSPPAPRSARRVVGLVVSLLHPALPGHHLAQPAHQCEPFRAAVPCVARAANMGQQSAGGNSSCCPKFESRTTPWPSRTTNSISLSSPPSHWRDCRFADALSPSLLKHLLKVEGDAAE